ncbi:MAG: M81 family metallopeptidase [Acidobacteria bacterium]|nr:M81 family metallopeptidase [Acidobacteriota bacterium]
MARLLVNECKQEVSSFNPVLSHYHDFLTDRGQDILDYHRPVRSEVGGALSVFESRSGLEVLGGFSARGITSAGTLTEISFQRLANEFLNAVRQAGPLDGVYLALHGALASEQTEDTEGYLIEETRKIVGPAVPIVVSLDLHGILTDRILAHSDAVAVYHTNPHVDFYTTGQRAAQLLLHLIDGNPRPVQIRIPISALVRGAQCITETGLFGSFVKRAVEIEGVLSAGLFIGNPFTDIEDLASNVLLVCDESRLDKTIELGKEIAADFWQVRAQIQQPLTSLEASIERAKSTPGRIVLVDAADATSSGASGDSNAILAQLLKAQCERTALVPLVDAPAVEACFKAGINAQLTLKLGGSLDPRFTPAEVTGRVRLLFDGKLRSESHGEAWQAGNTAVLEAGPITIVLTTRAVSLYDRTLFLACGQDPALFDMTVVKSPLCQPRFFEDGAALVIHVDAPGATSANVRSLGHTRAARPLYPLDLDMTYTPQPRIFRRN